MDKESVRNETLESEIRGSIHNRSPSINDSIEVPANTNLKIDEIQVGSSVILNSVSNRDINQKGQYRFYLSNLIIIDYQKLLSTRNIERYTRNSLSSLPRTKNLNRV